MSVPAFVITPGWPKYFTLSPTLNSNPEASSRSSFTILPLVVSAFKDFVGLGK